MGGVIVKIGAGTELRARSGTAEAGCSKPYQITEVFNVSLDIRDAANRAHGDFGEIAGFAVALTQQCVVI